MLSLKKKNNSLTRNYNRYTNTNSESDNIKIRETETTFHYELKIPGYVKEDFIFYINQDHLVVTTGRSKINHLVQDVSKKHKHSYCYPSAYFKMNVPLPAKFIKNKIFVDYENEILSFDLLKSEDISKDGLHI